MKYKRIVIFSAILCMCMAGCSGNADTSDSKSVSASNASSTIIEEKESDDEMFTSRDKEIGYDEETAVKITLSDTEAVCLSDSVEIKDNKVIIKEEGTYILSGKLSDGMVVVEADEKAKIQLVLMNAEINSTSSAPIYVKSADKVFITTAKDSENKLSTSGEFKSIDDNNIDSVVFAKSDLTLNGAGKLEISTDYGHGIVSKDDLVLTSGEYEIKSAGHGLSGKDSVRIADGTYNITSGKDAIKSENTDNAEKGFVYLAGGDLKLTAEGDGISASLTAEIKDGNYSIITGGGADSAEKKSGNMGFNRWQYQDTDDTSDITSTKGIKADGKITISGGEINIDSKDDSIHSNSTVEISDTNATLKSGDDGVHADTQLDIRNGSITVAKSYEGLESQTINIAGGTIDITASDDGINAGGGNDSSGMGERGGFSPDKFGSGTALLNISGGNIKVNSEGDGLDSNGSMTISGGTIYVYGPQNGGNGALDADVSPVITGGTVVAAGASQMAVNFGTESTQCSMMINTGTSQTGDIILKDSSGKTLVAINTEKSFDNVVISTPDIKVGETYTVTAGSSETTVEMTETIYGQSNGFGGFGGGRGGMQSPDNDRQPPNGMQSPNGNMGTPPDRW